MAARTNERTRKLVVAALLAAMSLATSAEIASPARVIEVPIEVSIVTRPGVPVRTAIEIHPSRTPLLARLPYHEHVALHAQKQKLDPALVHAVILVESNHNPAALSPKGALGLMQLMPETADRFSVRDRRDPSENIRGGTEYLRLLIDLFKGNLALAVAAYNAGEHAVMRHGNQIPPFMETILYVPKVLDEYARLRGEPRLPALGGATRTPEGRVRVTIPAGRIGAQERSP